MPRLRLIDAPTSVDGPTTSELLPAATPEATALHNIILFFHILITIYIAWHRLTSLIQQNCHPPPSRAVRNPAASVVVSSVLAASLTTRSQINRRKGKMVSLVDYCIVLHQNKFLG
jgi:hypothetical protein